MALRHQPSGEYHRGLAVMGIFVFLMGSVLVLSSLLRLGVHGTYLGDHFDIRKDSKVTGFPFSVCEHVY
jgi:phosphatidylethanolamine/phosphatidyl-N-methylethanolamine N-methyltransferase